MSHRPTLIALRAISLVCWPLSMSAAGAAAVEAPKATLIRLELQAFETPSPAAVATASCVTLILAHNFDAARRPCDAAISDAETDRSGSRLAPVMDRPYDVAAVAYNNRAVLRLLTGELELAAADSARALKADRLAPVERTAAVIAAHQRRAVAAD